MALIKCPECGKEISDKADKCPNCGFPISSPETMPNGNTSLPASKNKAFIIICIIIALTISGLGVFLYRQKVITQQLIEESIAESESIQAEKNAFIESTKTIFNEIDASNSNLDLFEGCFTGITQMQGDNFVTVQGITDVIRTTLKTKYTEEVNRKERIDAMLREYQKIDILDEDTEALKACTENLYNAYHARYESINGGMQFGSVNEQVSKNKEIYDSAYDFLKEALDKCSKTSSTN